MLRVERERQGLHIAVLAATIKVSPAKLDALEKDRYEQLPNATFTRALAQSVCRSLKIDPRPILAVLPQVDAPPLETAAGSLNTPFQNRSARGEPGHSNLSSRPLFWAGGVLLVAAIVIYLLPASWLQAPEPAASAALAQTARGLEAPAPASAASPVVAVPTTRSVPAAASAAQAAVPAAQLTQVAPASMSASSPAESAASAGAGLAAAPPGAVQLAASAPSWIEIVDGKGQVVLSRIVQPGESLGFSGPAPWRLKIGNVRGTELSFNGRAVDLAPHTRDNVARVELR